MARIYFVSEQYLQDNLPISRNLDIKDLTPHLQMAEELFIQDILGANFYTYLINAFSAQTLTNDEVILVQDYIKPAEAYRCLALALPFLNGQIKNKGSQHQFEDYSENPDLTYLKYLQNELDNRAQFYDKRLNSFLSLSGNSFSQYTTNNTDIISPNQQAGWDSGLIFYGGGDGIRLGCRTCNNQ
jgi:hypothetical protein